jgi:hypothetical protein
VSGLRFRPEIHVPWPYLAGFAALLYVIRSALRGWDFRPAPIDFLVWGGLAAIIAMRIWFGRGGDDDRMP